MDDFEGEVVGEEIHEGAGLMHDTVCLRKGGYSAALKLYIGLILQMISAVGSMFSTISSMLL